MTDTLDSLLAQLIRTPRDAALIAIIGDALIDSDHPAAAWWGKFIRLHMPTSGFSLIFHSKSRRLTPTQVSPTFDVVSTRSNPSASKASSPTATAPLPACERTTPTMHRCRGRCTVRQRQRMR